jgi:MoaA/NifB/PqqE/SkfB family radical SAM enzyme
MHDIAVDLHKLILDGTKIQWHQDRIAAWMRGERIAPITIDMSLTRACNYACVYCYAMMQENERKSFTRDTVMNFMDDAAEIGVKGVSLVSDGESTLSPFFVEAIERGHKNGLCMASGTNGFLLNAEKLRRILPCLTYLRFNITAGEPKRYAEIMGVPEKFFYKVCENIKTAVQIKKEMGLNVTIGLQMVLDPKYFDQVLPLARLGKELRPDYLVIKHCSDNEDGFLGVDYDGYEAKLGILREAEAMSDETYRVAAKWSKIGDKGTRSYERCYGPAFLLQLSGSGLVSPCGMLFGERYKKAHIGNIVETRFRDIYKSERYWEVMSYLASEDFNAKKMCGSLCLQHCVNTYLDGVKKGTIVLEQPTGKAPDHLAFV